MNIEQVRIDSPQATGLGGVGSLFVPRLIWAFCIAVFLRTGNFATRPQTTENYTHLRLLTAVDHQNKLNQSRVNKKECVIIPITGTAST